MASSDRRPGAAPRGGRRRSWVAWALVIAFVVLPLAEIYVLIAVGHVIGAGWTILLLVADSVAGAWLVKREGSRAWTALRTTIASGRMPHRELTDAGLVLVGGTLLVTPGFVTDALGVGCLLPFTRPVARRLVASLVARRVSVMAYRGSARHGSAAGTPGASGAAGPTPASGGPTQRRPGPVVQGDVVDRR